MGAAVPTSASPGGGPVNGGRSSSPKHILWIPTCPKDIHVNSPMHQLDIVFSSPLILLHRICLCCKILSAPLNQLYNFAAWAWAFTSCHVSFSRWGASFTHWPRQWQGHLKCVHGSRPSGKADFVEGIFRWKLFGVWRKPLCDLTIHGLHGGFPGGRAGLRFSKSRCRERNHRTAMNHYIDKFPVLDCW